MWNLKKSLVLLLCLCLSVSLSAREFMSYLKSEDYSVQAEQKETEIPLELGEEVSLPQPTDTEEALALSESNVKSLRDWSTRLIALSKLSRASKESAQTASNELLDAYDAQYEKAINDIAKLEKDKNKLHFGFGADALATPTESTVLIGVGANMWFRQSHYIVSFGAQTLNVKDFKFNNLTYKVGIGVEF